LCYCNKSDAIASFDESVRNLNQRQL